MFAVVLAYAGVLVALLGLVALIKPLAFVRITNRKRAAVVLAAGLLTTLTALLLPASEMTVQTPNTTLDRVMPSYQFNEVHSIRIQATPERIYQAIKEVTADEILFFRTLIWIRRFGRSGPESIMNAPERQPLLEVATRTTFVTLADQPDEIVVGTVVMAPRDVTFKRPLTLEEYNAIHGPGFAVASMNFLIKKAQNGVCDVSTETRVYATDASVRRRFAAYWRIIYPGSALIRRMWLRAIKLRAQAA